MFGGVNEMRIAIVVISIVTACVGCAPQNQRARMPAPADGQSVREQLKVPEGVMLCMVKYPTKAPPEVAEQFHASVQKLNGALGSSKIEYNVTGYLANMFYIRSDHEKAKQLIIRSMVKEPFDVEFH